MKVALFTTFQDFNPGYSLTGIVKDQIDMLTRYGHEAHLLVSVNFNDKQFLPPTNGQIHRVVPFAHLKDYTTREDLTEDHVKTVKETRDMLVQVLTENDIDIVFSHDIVFTGWNMPYALGTMRATSALPKVKWLHWIHSVPSQSSDWWTIREYGENHKLVFPNFTDRIRVAEQYRGWPDSVAVIPHIKDLRTYADFGEDTCRFIDKYPGVMQSAIVQILPASVDRLTSKRVKEVIQIIASMKNAGASVCLVVANQWATLPKHKEETSTYNRYAFDLGLNSQEVIFTSDFEPPTFEVGVPKKMLRELFMLSNLFIFPTKEESFGLVVPEASLAGGCFLVLNASLDMQREVCGNQALMFDFGSHFRGFEIPSPDYYVQVAKVIIARMKVNEAVMTKTFMRTTYNMDALWKRTYEPIMMEMIGVK